MGTAPEQKTESAKDGKDSMSLPSFQSLCVQQVAPTSICKGGKNVYLYYSARFSRFIDSLNTYYGDKLWLQLLITVREICRA